MTRGEAIDRLSVITFKDSYPLLDKALKMAIAALKTEPCGNAINKDKVFDILDYWYDEDSDGYVQACKSINELPPVQPIRPRGHWILVSDGTPGGYWKCSECLCHKTMGFGHKDWFCPCCGADMRESEEQA